MSHTADQPSATRVEAPAASDPVVRRIIVAVMLFGFAAWMIVDHYVLGKYPPGNDLNANMAYYFNHYLPFILTPAAIFFLVWALRHMGQKIIADLAGIGFAGKPQIRWSEIDRVDAHLLAPKGLLVLQCQGRQIKLDSYCFKNFRELVAFIERHVPAERIIR